MTEGISIHVIPPLLVCISSFSIALFVLLKNPKSRVNRSFFLLGLSAAVWQFTRAMIYISSDVPHAMFWSRISHSVICFLTASTYHFVVSFLHLRKKALICLFYTFSFISIFLVQTDYFIVNVNKFYWGYYPLLGPVHNIYLPLWIVPLLLSLVHLYRKYREVDSPFNKKRIKYFLVTLPIAYAALIDIVPNYGIELYPLGFIPILFFIVSTSYAIVRYRLMDIETIVKKVSLSSLVFVGSLGIVYIGTFCLQPYLYDLWGRNWIVFPVLVSCLVSAGLFKFLNFVRHIEEDELSKRFAYRSLLRKEAERISQVRSLDGLLTYITRDLSSWVRLDYVGIFFWDTHRMKYVLVRSLTRSPKREKIPLGLSLSADGCLVQQLIKTKKPLVYSEIDYSLYARETLPEERENRGKVLAEMKRLGTEISIPCFCEERLLAIINIGNKLNQQEIVTHEDLDVLSSLSNTIARAAFGFVLKEEKIQLIVASQNILITAIEAKDRCTRGHTDRVAHYSSLMGNKLEKYLRGLSNGLSDLNWAAQLHDVGKISIPDSILLKPGPLNGEEWEKIRQHPANGLRIISPVREWLGEDICTGILHHHENYDGSGYPYGKKGRGIHIFARIIRVADTFDAMCTDRPYRPAFKKEEVIDELKRHKGIYFDPLVVEVLEELYYKGQMPS